MLHNDGNRQKIVHKEITMAFSEFQKAALEVIQGGEHI
jgi:hypothetical protein